MFLFTGLKKENIWCFPDRTAPIRFLSCQGAASLVDFPLHDEDVLVALHRRSRTLASRSKWDYRL